MFSFPDRSPREAEIQRQRLYQFSAKKPNAPAQGREAAVVPARRLLGRSRRPDARGAPIGIVQFADYASDLGVLYTFKTSSTTALQNAEQADAPPPREQEVLRLELDTIFSRQNVLRVTSQVLRFLKGALSQALALAAADPSFDVLLVGALGCVHPRGWYGANVLHGLMGGGWR